MSPGPLSSAQRGGLTFQHGGGRHFGRQAPPSRNRTYFSPHQRFTVSPSAGGGSTISLDESETVTVGTDLQSGAVTIEVAPKPAEDTLSGNGVARRRAMPLRERMVLAAQPDGSLLISPSDPENQIIALGDPDDPTGVQVLEVEPVGEPAGG